MSYQIDHLVYAVPNLEKAIKRFKLEYGITAKLGGKHLDQGTKNALIHLGDKCYLELIAKDNNNPKSKDLWMGLTLLSEAKITRWALLSKNLENETNLLKRINPKLSTNINGSRIKQDGSKLTWSMTKPLAIPEVEICPFFVDWKASTSHPTDDMPMEAQLLGLLLCHPNPSKFERLFSDLNQLIELEIKEDICIKAKIKGPKGIFIL